MASELSMFAGELRGDVMESTSMSDMDASNEYSYETAHASSDVHVDTNRTDLLTSAQRDLSLALSQMFGGEHDVNMEILLPSDASASRGDNAVLSARHRVVLAPGTSKNLNMDALAGALSLHDNGKLSICMATLHAVHLVVDARVSGIPRWLWKTEQELAIADTIDATFGDLAIGSPRIRQMQHPGYPGTTPSSSAVPLSEIMLTVEVPFATLADAQSSQLSSDTSMLTNQLRRALRAPRSSGVSIELMKARVEATIDSSCSGSSNEMTRDALSSSAFRAAWRRAHQPHLQLVEVQGQVNEVDASAITWDRESWLERGMSALASEDDLAASRPIRRDADDVEAGVIASSSTNTRNREDLHARLRAAVQALSTIAAAKESATAVSSSSPAPPPEPPVPPPPLRHEVQSFGLMRPQSSPLRYAQPTTRIPYNIPTMAGPRMLQQPNNFNPYRRRDSGAYNNKALGYYNSYYDGVGASGHYYG
ncbi:hypothetical protein PPROV_000544800 [Pycnococcus provasolii]|uniref:Uncharacterized protein n=1 Tax=Pycnococcus provasolii TaxID=41880 RepID=A0A830HJE7_9CHLO|nr:hypothetical protein PPROV_000544800 [Pycnococcus provasolii]